MTMNHVIPLLLTVFFSTLLPLAGQVVNTFPSPESLYLRGRGAAEAALGRDRESGSGKEYTFLKLKSPAGISLELFSRDQRWLGKRTSGIIQLRLIPSEANLIAQCQLRMVDKPGEVFQFSPTRRFRDGRVEVFEFRFGEEQIRSSWGQKVNRKFDPPLSFAGFSLRSNAVPSPGKLYLVSAELLPEEATGVRIRRPLLSAPFQKYSTRQSQFQGKSTLTAENEAFIIAGDAQNFHLVIHDLFEIPLTHLKAIRLSLASDVPGKAGIVVVDPAGRKISTAPVAFGPGQSVVEVPFAAGEVERLSFRFLTLSFARTPYRCELSGMEAVENGSQAAALEVKLSGDNPFLIQEPGTEKKFRLKVRNLSDQPLTSELKVHLEDYFRTQVDRRFQLSLAPDETRVLPLTDSLPRQGVWYGRYEVGKCADGSRRIGDFHLANMPMGRPTPLPQPGEFLFGMNCHFSYWNDYNFNLALQAMIAAHVKLVRAAVYWDHIQYAPDKFRWEYADRLVNSLQKSGIAHNWCVYPVPKWAVPENVRDKGYSVFSRTAPMPGLYGKFMEILAERYRGKVRYYEVWNEADLLKTITVDDYIRVLREGYEGVKKSDPGALVTTTGFASLVHPAVRKNFQRDVLRQARGFYDVHALHEHGGFGWYASIIDNQVLPLRRRLGVTAPWYANETAVTSAGGQDRMQAETVFKKILFSFARGSASYIWYNLRSKGRNPNNAEHCYGLMTADFQPKFGYGVFSALAGLYAGVKFYGDLSPFPGQYCFRFRDNRRILLAAWNEAPSLGTTPMVVRTDGTEAFLVDLFGNRRKLQQENGIVVFPVGTVPGSLELPGATRAEYGHRVLTAEAPAAVLPGREHPLKFTLQNPFAKEVAVSIKLQAPAGIRCSETEFSRRLPAGGSGIWNGSFFVTRDMRLHRESPPVISAEYRFDHIDTGVMYLPLNPAYRIPAGDFSGRAPDFELEKITHVFNRYQADPANQHRLWKGPDDLSAKIWLGRGADALKLRVVVRDDVHVQPEKGMLTWTGDNIQLSLISTGMFEISLTRLADGTAEVYPTAVPSGFDSSEVAKEIRLVTARRGNETIYEVEFPLEAVGLSNQLMKNGFQFNLIINDNDGDGRDGWLFLAEGMGKGGSVNTTQFPYLVFEENP